MDELSCTARFTFPTLELGGSLGGLVDAANVPIAELPAQATFVKGFRLFYPFLATDFTQGEMLLHM